MAIILSVLIFQSNIFNGMFDNLEKIPYSKGYETGLQGNEKAYNDCLDYHSMYWENHVILCSIAPDSANDDTFQYARGYIHGYKKKLERDKANQIQKNMSGYI